MTGSGSNERLSILYFAVIGSSTTGIPEPQFPEVFGINAKAGLLAYCKKAGSMFCLPISL